MSFCLLLPLVLCGFVLLVCSLLRLYVYHQFLVCCYCDPDHVFVLLLAYCCYYLDVVVVIAIMIAFIPMAVRLSALQALLYL